MKAILITEGGRRMGFGHITRCLALYNAFKRNGVLTRIVVSGDSSVKPLLKGVDFEILNWINKKKYLVDLAGEFEIAVIDSYLAGTSIYEAIADSVKIAIYLDDNNRLRYPKGVIVNGAVYAHSIRYPQSKIRHYLLGAKYTPIREEFLAVRRKKIPKQVKIILITFGGDDVQNMTPKILEFLSEYYSFLNKKVVVGNGFMNKEDIKKASDARTELLYNLSAKGMKELMMKSDIAIAAGGQTLYELARVGVPTLAVAVAENQINNCDGWMQKGFLEYAGWHSDKRLNLRLSTCIERLLDYGHRVKCSNKGRKIIDAKGADRIAVESIKLAQI